MAEPYILTFWKLKKIFNSIIPDTLIIGFAPHNISQFNDLKFSNETWSVEMFKRSYPIQEFNKISNQIPVDFPTFYRTLWKETAFYPKSNHVNFIGNYFNSNKTDTGDFEAAIKRHYYQNETKLNVSDIAVTYLDSIIELCEAKNIELVLVCNPVQKEYLNNIPASIMDQFIDLSDRYDFNHTVYSKISETYPDSLFLDSDHLNANGAEKFTRDLIEYINSSTPTKKALEEKG
jgi:hypothetical protein